MRKNNPTHFAKLRLSLAGTQRRRIENETRASTKPGFNQAVDDGLLPAGKDSR